MTRVVASCGVAAMAVLIASSALATPSNLERCHSLAAQWKTAETANASNPNLGKARALASSAEKMCASASTTQQKSGVSQYNAAIHACVAGGHYVR
jgi:hypothetical protein